MPVIIVLGVRPSDACDPREMEWRCERAAELYRAGRFSRLIACGGRADGEGESEASRLRQILLGMNIPSRAISMENRSRTTMENMRNAQAMADAAGESEFVVVTSDYHKARVRLIARRLGMNARVIGAKTPFTPAKLRRALLEIPCKIDILLGFEDMGAKRPAWRKAVMKLFHQDKP